MIENLDEIKSFLDPMEVLRYIGHEKSKPQASGGEIRDFCPIHGGDHQKSLAIGKDGSFLCHSCDAKGGDLISLYQQARKIDFPTAVQELAGRFGINVDHATKFGSSKIKSGAPISRAAPLPKEDKISPNEEENLQKSRMKAAEIFIKSDINGTHPYFEKKGIKPPAEIRYGFDEKGNPAIVVPYRDIEGTLQAIQYVNGNPPPNKFFATGTTTNGAFFNFGFTRSSTSVYLCEGIATAASIWESGHKAITTLSCGSSWNIPKVLKAVREKYPELKIIVCLDDDKAGDETEKKIRKMDHVHVSFRRPDFTGLRRGEKDKDFNDLHRLAGIDAVQAQLQGAPPPSEKEPSKKILEVKFISELPINYLEVDAPPKPRLMYFVEKNGTKKDFLHREIVAMLVASGGTGKTHLLAHLALCTVTGIPFLEKFEFDTPGNVCFIAGENADADMHRLIRKAKLNLETLLKDNERKHEHERFGLHNKNPFERAAERLAILSVHGQNASFIGQSGSQTQFFQDLLRQLKEKEPKTGWQLIILDPISRFAGLDAEKDNALATAFIACTESLSEELKGRPTIMLSHHKPKAAVAAKESDATAARGASAFTDGCRWQANLDRSEEKDIAYALRVVKSNFTSIPEGINVKKDNSGSPKFDSFITR